MISGSFSSNSKHNKSKINYPSQKNMMSKHSGNERDGKMFQFSAM